MIAQRALGGGAAVLERALQLALDERDLLLAAGWRSITSQTSAGMSRPAATRSCTKAASMRAVSGVARPGSPSSGAIGTPMKTHLSTAWSYAASSRCSVAYGPERRGDQARVVRADGVVDEPAAAVAERQVRQRAEQAAPLRGVAEAVELGELGLGRLAHRGEEEHPGGVVDGPGVHVLVVGVRVERAAPDLAPDGGEAGADGGGVGGDRRLGLAHPLGALGRRASAPAPAGAPPGS